MAVSRRKEINDILISELKNINGDVAPFDSAYT